LVGDGQLDVMPLARRHHRVGLAEVAAQRLFEEDARPRLGTGDDHVVMLIEVPIRDADYVRALLPQHCAIIGVGMGRAEPLLRREPARLVLVGDGDDLHVVELPPDDVQPVAVVAAPGPADDGDAILSWHGALFICGCRATAARPWGWPR